MSDNGHNKSPQAQPGQFGIHTIRKEKSPHRNYFQQQSLLHVSKLVCSSQDLNSILHEIAKRLVENLSATSAYIYSNNPLNDTSVLVAEYFDPDEAIENRQSKIGEIYRVKRNFLSDEFSPFKNSAIRYYFDDEDIDELIRAKMEKHGAKSILIFPLLAKGKIIAYVEIWESRFIREFTREECLLAEELSQYAAIAMENTRLINAAHWEIEKRARIQKQVEHDTFHDLLTGLPNRSLVHDRVSSAMGRANGDLGENFAIILIGLDHFKSVNDSLGHQIGDKVLVSVADRLREVPRSQDLLARVGGDEFLILVEDIEHVGFAISEAVNVLKSLRTKFEIGPYEIYASASIGIVMGSYHHDTPDHVLRDAEIALYSAKGDGRGGYRIFHPDMQSTAMARYQTVGSLRNALEKDEFELYYQPIIGLATNHLMGFEALIRWNHPRMGIIPASKFISIAEDSGLIYPIGLWTLQRACEQMARWRSEIKEDSRYGISINISAKQLQNADLIESVQSVLHQTGISPETLILEVTENSIIQNMDLATKNTKRLKDLGVHIHLDNFGVGYSSLNVLQCLPIDALKLDKSFIQEISHNPRSLDIVKSVLQLCKNLNIEVIAEGIETKVELDMLQKLECELGQGYYFSKAVDEENASALLQKSVEH